MSEQLDETLGELMIDFTDAAASTAPASCQVFGLQPPPTSARCATITSTDGVTSTYRLAYELSGPDQRPRSLPTSPSCAVVPDTTVQDDTIGYRAARPLGPGGMHGHTEVLGIDAP
ncbi:MAG: hypothetical protein R2761_20105 [Acidimicrobiales bacterium]